MMRLMMRLWYRALMILAFVASNIIITSAVEDIQGLDSARPKIIYLKTLTNLQDQTIYVGQEVFVTYEVSLFAGASLKGSSFDKIARDKIELQTKSVSWKATDSGSLQATYGFKIKSSSANIPALNATALAADGSYEENARADSIALNAIDLRSNTRYIGVLGNNFKLLRSRSQSHDDTHNIVIFEFEIQSQNLNNMTIKGFETQGFEELKQRDDGSVYGIYYVVVPKDLRELLFEYFNPDLRRFESVHIPIVVVSSELVSTQSDLNPKASYALFKLVILGVLIALFLGLFLWKHYKIFLFIVALLCGVLIYNLAFNNLYGVVKPGAAVSILPMKDSTIVRIIESDTPVQIVGERKMDIQGQEVLLYKVLIGDSQIGWVRSEYVSKN
ncbi:SH3 domain-containing protein [uncultured Helicobacter sp.]|uniref:SH3 domain-containing protein n=2 Tax=uncultured Helicobacter sp. TaxID=175537 RepID=UPI003750199B